MTESIRLWLDAGRVFVSGDYQTTLCCCAAIWLHFDQRGQNSIDGVRPVIRTAGTLRLFLCNKRQGG
jgi:hypothetical protein